MICHIRDSLMIVWCHTFSCNLSVTAWELCWNWATDAILGHWSITGKKSKKIAELSSACSLVIISGIHARVFLNCSIWSMLNHWEIFPSLNGFLYWSVSQLSGYIPSYWQRVELTETNRLKLSTIAVQTEQISYLLLHGLNYHSFHFLINLI